MSARADTITFNLVQNATDSIVRTVELMAWGEMTDEGARLKQAILSIGHAVELLLKERLRQVHPSLVWEDVDKFPNLDARTVGVDRAIHRLRRIGGVELSSEDIELVKSLRNTRNAIEHFAWTTTRQEANAVVGRALSFAIAFAQTHLGVDIAFLFKRDDTWQQLFSSSHHFAKAHSARHDATVNASVQQLLPCEFCNALAVSHSGGSCALCGHWNVVEDDAPF